MAVPAVNLTIEKGADFATSLKIKSDGGAVNLTGYSFSCKMRKHPTASTAYNFVVTAIAPYSSGIVKIEMAKNNTSQVPTGRYFWDLLITYAGVTTKAVKGTVIVEGTAS